MIEAPHPNGSGGVSGAHERPRTRTRRVLQVAALVIVAAWAIAITYSLTRDEPEPLDDTSHAELEQACTGAENELRELAPIGPGATVEQRTARIDAENEVLAAMLVRMRGVEPTDADGAEALDGWLDDWDALLEARAAYRDDLHQDGSAELNLPTSDNVEPAAILMNEYATMHDLVACNTSALQAETVEGVRDYDKPVE